MSRRRQRLLPGPQPPVESWTRVGRFWVCPACGKRYPKRGQGHSCVVVSLDEHFLDRPRARELFDALCRAIRGSGGPFRLSIAKTRIGMITNITFASAMPRKRHLRVAFLLLRKIDSPRFARIEHLSPYWLHTFDLRDEAELDDEACGWFGETYRVGQTGAGDQYDDR